MGRVRDGLSRWLHSSWLIMWLALGLVAGIGLSAATPVRLGSWALALAASLLVVAFTRRSVAVVGLVVIAGVLVGLWRGGLMQAALTAYQPYYGKHVVAAGTVSEDPTVESSGEQRIRLHHVSIDDQKLPGTVWVSMSSSAQIKRSDRVSVRGVLSEGFGNLPASMFRAQLVGAERVPYADVGRDVRDWFAAQIRSVIDEPEASLGIGFLVGQRSSLPEELDEQLRIVGLTHVVVASGYNLTILVRFARRAFERTSKYLAFLSASTMITVFVLMTGFSPSMSRAALVTGLSLLAWYVGRTIQPLVILSVVAAATAIINPAFVWGDIGWYLSFSAFAGIMLLAPLVKHYFWGPDAQFRTLPSIVLETMCAQLATMPLIIFIFAQYSPFAVPVNALVLPLIPLTMLATFLAGVAAVAVPVAGSVIALPAVALLSYITSLVAWVASWPGATAELTFGLTGLIVSYSLLIFAMVYMWRKTKHNFGKDNIVL